VPSAPSIRTPSASERATPHRPQRAAITTALTLITLLPLLTLTACSYALQGRAVRGDYSAIEVVDSSDPRLTDAKSALSGVTLNLQSDPNKLNRKNLGRAVSGRTGEFRIPIDEFGAGVLDYDIGAYARKKGYEPAEGFFQLPGGGKRLLITMAPGEDKETNEQPTSLQEEFNLKTFR
jgi:hypothetical protein